jgi:hypothetical protein
VTIEPHTEQTRPIKTRVITSPACSPTVTFGAAYGGGCIDVSVRDLPDCYVDKVEFYAGPGLPRAGELLAWVKVGRDARAGDTVIANLGPSITRTFLNALPVDYWLNGGL